MPGLLIFKEANEERNETRVNTIDCFRATTDESGSAQSVG
jgi:hypothetical protein